MNVRYAGVLALLLSATVLAAGSQAQSQTHDPVEPWPYDGTGSRYYAAPSDVYDPKYAVAERDKIEGQRETFLAGIAKNHMIDMISMAALLEDGVTSAGFDRAGAMDLYERAAEGGNTVGRRKMCVAYFLGEGRPVNRVKAAGYCNLLPENDATHMFALAWDSDHSKHADADNDSILATYLEAAKRGSADAMDVLGQKAQALAAPEAARNWFRQGAALGSADAIDHLAVMTEAGQGSAADADEAYWLYVNAANRGNMHARGWIAALPAPHQPLGRMSYKGDGDFLIETTKGDKGPHIDRIGREQVGHALETVYPAEIRQAEITVHCYIGTAHNIDVCLPEREMPPGTDFTQSLNWLFYRNLSVDDMDLNGRSTAHTVLLLAFKWVHGS